MRISIFVSLFFLMSFSAIAQQQNLTSLALGGYDPVAYFTKAQAIEGTNKITATHEEVTYYFSSVEHKELFEKNPTKYQPQYGGFCATGVATANAKFPIDPETFQVTDGKLYLFYNGPYNGEHFNGKTPWLKDEAALTQKANSNWSTLKN